MKLTARAFTFSLLLIGSALTAFAQTSHEQLPQMVEQLQTAPTDNALREKIIKLAQTLDPRPTVPDEALRREGRGKFAFRSAKTNEDYIAAAKEYEEAVRVAPWINGYYSDLCTIYEKAEDFVSAKRNCEFSLIGLTDKSQISETKQRIAGLEFGIEKAAKDKAAAETPEAKEAAFLAKLEGARYVFHTDQSPVPGVLLTYDKILEIRKGVLIYTVNLYRLVDPGVDFKLLGKFTRPGNYELARMQRENEEYRYADPMGFLWSFTITPDGSAIHGRIVRNPPDWPSSDAPSYVETYPRQ